MGHWTNADDISTPAAAAAFGLAGLAAANSARANASIAGASAAHRVGTSARQAIRKVGDELRREREAHARTRAELEAAILRAARAEGALLRMRRGG